MNSRGRYILSIFGLLILAATTAAAKSDLATPDQRHALVNQASALAQLSPPAALPADLPSPFVLARDKKQAMSSSKQPTGDRQVLAAIATHVKPSGVVQVSGSPMLLLREKKLKVGDYLTITFEGTDYMVELAAINHSSFTLRLNKEEITQPINP